MTLNARTLALLSIGVVALAAAGSFGGMWAWSEWQQAQVRSAAQAASAAAAAERQSPRGVQREVVKGFMFDPESAQFRNDVPAVRGGDGVWCGEINGRNRMGGMVGFTRYVAEVYTDRELASVMDRVHFERNGTGARDDDGFPNKWRIFCER